LGESLSVRIIHSGEPCGGVIVRCDGVVTGKELVEVNDLVATEPGQRYQLWDFSNADCVDITLDEIQKLAIQDSSIPKESNLQAVLIVGKQHSLLQLADTYETFSSKWVGRRRNYKTEMLPTMPEAKKWLRDHLDIDVVG
jgi:hypothetical protein